MNLSSRRRRRLICLLCAICCFTPVGAMASEKGGQIAEENQTNEVKPVTSSALATTFSAITVTVPDFEVAFSKVLKPKASREQKDLKRLQKFFTSFNSTSTDMSKNLGISKKTFVKIMKKLPYDYANVFENNAEYLWKTAKKHDFNEFLMPDIMAQESRWGADPIATNNYSSQRRGESSWYSYATPESSIDALANNLDNNYLKKRKSLQEIGAKYCPGSKTWAVKVCSCGKMILREYL